MFTGIVEELGRFEGRAGARFHFACSPGFLEGAAVGESVAHNGACLTLVGLAAGGYEVDVVDETLDRTNLGDLNPGDPVNLERAVRLQDRLGGHLVLGHVDAIGRVVRGAPNLVVALAPHLTRYVVEKGSIAVDGCSLTVAAVEADRFEVAVIPHTAEVTTLGRARPGDRVNLEVDIMAKHAEKLLAAHLGSSTDSATADSASAETATAG